MSDHTEEPLDYLLHLNGDELLHEQIRIDMIKTIETELAGISIRIEPVGVRESVISYTHEIFIDDENSTVDDYFYVEYFERIGAAYVSKQITEKDLSLLRETLSTHIK